MRARPRSNPRGRSHPKPLTPLSRGGTPVRRSVFGQPATAGDPRAARRRTGRRETNRAGSAREEDMMAADRASIQAFLDQAGQVWKTIDGGAFAELFTGDGSLINPFGERVDGR